MRIIAHLDMDYFFAQIEERENPKLKGQPVVVGALPKKGRGRGVVSTANYEARKFGINSGMPISWAYRACPGAIFLPVRFSLYQEVSEKIRKVIETMIKRISESKIEQASLDEFYFDLSGFGDFKKAREFILKLREEIYKSENLTCSVGIGPSKLLAKIASGFKKPNGVTIVEEFQVLAFLSPRPIEIIPGIGPKTGQILHQLKIKKVSDLQKLSKEKLVGLLGKWGENLWENARGIDNSKVLESQARKTLGVQITFERDTQNFYFLRRTLFDLCGEVWRQIQEEKLIPQMIEVTVRYFDFETHSRQETLKEPLKSLYQFRQEGEALFKKLAKEKLIRLLGVRVGKWKSEVKA